MTAPSQSNASLPASRRRAAYSARRSAAASPIMRWATPWWPRPCRASIRSTRSRLFRAASGRSATPSSDPRRIAFCSRTYAPPPQPFLAGTTANRIEASETTEREIDLAVREIVTKAFGRATEVLRARRADLDEGARLLLAQETVTADQFPAILPAARATRVNSAR